ncbi:MAG: tetratricopeptide repeat protein [Pseudomonadota bacterium]
MKILTKLLLEKPLILVFIFLLCSCSDKQKQHNAELLRHENSAKIYQEQGQIKAATLEAKRIIQLDPENPTGYLLLAKIYNGIGAYSASQNLLESIVIKIPALSTELAESYMASKKYHSAIKTITQYPAAPNNNADLKRQTSMAASAYFYLGDHAKSTEMLDKFTSLGGSLEERQYIEASKLAFSGEIESAQKILLNMLQEKPENIAALILLSETYAAQQEFNKAENHLTKLLSLLPNTDIISTERIKVLSQLTEVLIRQGRSSEAYVYQKILAEANPEGNTAQERFNDAMKFYQQGNFVEAEAILKALRSQFPRDKNTATLLGMIEFQKGENEKASHLFDEFIDAETTASTVIQAAALVKYRKNQVDEALELLKKAAESQPGNAAILATYGLALLDRDNKSAEGALILEKSLTLNPGQQRIRLALAKRYIALGETNQALAQLNKAYKQTPLDFVLQEAYLKALFENGQADKVKQEVELFKSQFPDSARGPFVEGWYHMAQKNYAAAEKAFTHALSLPNNTEKQLSYTGLAQLHGIQKQSAKAINAWQRAIEADPTIISAYAHWFNQLLLSNKQEDAFNFLLDIESRNVTTWQPSMILAQLYANKKQWIAAEKHIDIALSRSPSSDNIKKLAAAIYQMEGLDFRSMGKLQEARTYFLKAIKLVPDNTDYLANMIETELADKKIVEAQKLLNEYPKTESNMHIHQFFQGAIRLAENKPDEAIKAYLESWKLKPTEAVASSIFGYYERNNQQTQLAAFIDDWVQKLPKSAKASMLKALQAQNMKDDTTAIKWYEKTIELSPNMAAALNNLAWMYYLHKDERALSLAKRAFDAEPNSISIQDTYGWILVELGNVKEGIAILERAAKETNNVDIKNHLKEAKLRLN